MRNGPWAPIAIAAALFLGLAPGPAIAFDEIDRAVIQIALTIPFGAQHKMPSRLAFIAESGTQTMERHDFGSVHQAPPNDTGLLLLEFDFIGRVLNDIAVAGTSMRRLNRLHPAAEKHAAIAE